MNAEVQVYLEEQTDSISHIQGCKPCISLTPSPFPSLLTEEVPLISFLSVFIPLSPAKPRGSHGRCGMAIYILLDSIKDITTKEASYPLARARGIRWGVAH